MTAPRWFLDALDRDFGGRLRLRWSPSRGEWHIEQRTGRGKILPRYVSERDDELIRARDGYDFVMAIRPGDRMPCPVDGATMKVPVMEFREALCPTCRRAGRDGRFRASFWPLSESLLTHLRRIDPERDGLQRMLRELNDEDYSRQWWDERRFSIDNYYALRDGLLEQLPKAGFPSLTPDWASS